MTGVTARLDDGDVHARPPHMLRCVLSESRADPATLKVGIDADDVDDTHPLVEHVQRDGDEADRACVRDGDEDVTVGIGTARSDRVGLIRPPVGMKAKKDVVAQDVADHWDALPPSERAAQRPPAPFPPLRAPP